MAEKVVSPGVFTSEIDASFLPAAIAEIGAAVIGPTVKGPAGIPTLVNSFAEFEAKFGTTFKSGSGYQQYLTSHTVKEYLRNSNQVTVVRILAGSYSKARSDVSCSVSVSTVSAGAASASLTAVAIEGRVSESMHQLTLGSVDYIGVVSSSLFSDSTAERYFNVGSTIDEYGANLAAEINTALSSSIGNTRADYTAGTNKLKLFANDSGSTGNAAVTTASMDATNNQNVWTSDYTTGTIADRFNVQGGSDSTSGTNVSFVIHTLGDGEILNNKSYSTPVEGINNKLASGSKDNIRWEVPNVNNAKGTFTLMLRRGDDTSKRKTTLETWNNLSLDPNSTNYIAKMIGDSVNTVRVDENLAPFLQASGSYLNKSKYIRIAPVATTPDYLDANGKIVADAFSGSLPAVSSGSFYGGTDGTVQHPKNFYEDITDTNSQGLNPATVGTTDGYDQYIEALNLLANADEYDINMIVLPGIINSIHGGVVSKAVDVCEGRGDCFVIADPVRYGSTITGAVTEADKFDSNYSAMYWPWVQIPDVNLGKNVWVPPSTVLAGIYAFNDKVAHPWYAPAGLNRGGIDVAIQAERKLTQADRDTLYESSINPIATFPGQGVVVFGQKTLQKKASALDRINVRRLLIKVKKFIASSSKFLVFEQNTAATRRRFLNIVNPYLEQVQANSGLSAFRVVMDDTNNTPDLVDRNILYGQIFVQPTRTAEFIILDFTVQPTGATFPE